MVVYNSNQTYHKKNIHYTIFPASTAGILLVDREDKLYHVDSFFQLFYYQNKIIMVIVQNIKVAPSTAGLIL